mmetsp:Transcript_38135/g.79295  ORF Transcript_38135/g.79295 Transcript_38135/m.79295 type:complete len:254 (-) Transcript_38135:161-922(-)
MLSFKATSGIINSLVNMRSIFKRESIVNAHVLLGIVASHPPKAVSVEIRVMKHKDGTIGAGRRILKVSSILKGCLLQGSSFPDRRRTSTFRSRWTILATATATTSRTTSNRTMRASMNGRRSAFNASVPFDPRSMSCGCASPKLINHGGGYSGFPTFSASKSNRVNFRDVVVSPAQETSIGTTTKVSVCGIIAHKLLIVAQGKAGFDRPIRKPARVNNRSAFSWIVSKVILIKHRGFRDGFIPVWQRSDSWIH